MRKLIIRFALGCMLIGSGTVLRSSTAKADMYFLLGNDLYDFCKADSGTTGGLLCLAYVVGVADALSTARIAGFRACIPTYATKGQVRDVATHFLTNHPESRQYTAASLVAGALSGAYPCK